MAADEGASPRELVLEAARRNNTELLEQVLSSTKPSRTNASRGQDDQDPTEAAIANLLNESRDGTGSTCLHIAALAGNLEILDLILDQPGVETDPLTPRDKNTPLHSAVEFANAQGPEDFERGEGSTAGGLGKEVVEILVDAGCDPRARNKGKAKPLDLVDPRNKALREFLRKAEMLLAAGHDIVNEDEQDDAPDGPGSESD